MTLDQRAAPVLSTAAHRGKAGITPIVPSALLGRRQGRDRIPDDGGCDDSGIGAAPGILIGAPAGACSPPSFDNEGGSFATAVIPAWRLCFACWFL